MVLCPYVNSWYFVSVYVEPGTKLDPQSYSFFNSFTSVSLEAALNGYF
jgi:hypothetical protein